MCEDDYEREIVKDLFRIVLDRLRQSDYEKFELNVKMKEVIKQREMENMAKVVGGDKV